jgi:flagellar motor switch protein FliG
MSMLARYKKGGGILELVKLVEDSPEPKRSQLLTMVRNEDPEFAARVEARIFNWDKVKELSENVIAEIIAVSAPKFLALALIGEDPKFVTLAERCLGKNFSEYKSEKEAAIATAPTPQAIEAARRKVIAEARKLEANGQIKLISGDADAALAATGGGGGANNAAAANAAAAGSAGSASGDAGVPAIASFGLEPPPPGLNGERFQTFVKGLLGF